MWCAIMRNIFLLKCFIASHFNSAIFSITASGDTLHLFRPLSAVFLVSNFAAQN
jgi:hypothetical protein